MKMSRRHLLCVFWMFCIFCIAAMTSTTGRLLQGQEDAEQSQPPSTDFIIQQFPNDSWRVFTTTFNNPLGFEVEAIGGALRAQLALEEGSGVVVTNVMPESEAAKAGLQQYDVLLKVDDTLITTPEMLHEVVREKPGKKITLHLVRHGNPLSIEYTLPETVAYEWSTSLGVDALADHYRIGVTLAQADDTLRNQLRLAAGEGLVVTEVVSEGPAAKAGIQQHDVLTKLDGRRLSTVENLEAQLQEIKDRSVTLEFLRRGQEMSCELVPQLSNQFQPYLNTANARIWWGDLSHQAVMLNDWQRAEIKIPLTWQPDITVQPAEDAASAPAAETVSGQLAELKQQLAAMQKSLEALEAAMQKAAPAEAPPQE